MLNLLKMVNKSNNTSNNMSCHVMYCSEDLLETMIAISPTCTDSSSGGNSGSNSSSSSSSSSSSRRESDQQTFQRSLGMLGVSLHTPTVYEFAAQ
jgi:hypothetical protein